LATVSITPVALARCRIRARRRRVAGLRLGGVRARGGERGLGLPHRVARRADAIGQHGRLARERGIGGVALTRGLLQVDLILLVARPRLLERVARDRLVGEEILVCGVDALRLARLRRRVRDRRIGDGALLVGRRAAVAEARLRARAHVLLRLIEVEARLFERGFGLDDARAILQRQHRARLVGRFGARRRGEVGRLRGVGRVRHLRVRDDRDDRARGDVLAGRDGEAVEVAADQRGERLGLRPL
jgi:hypothetical protein